MSRFERWTLTISVISTVVTVAAFALVWLQLSNANESLRTAVYANMSNWTFELDKAALEYPELRPYFADGVDLPTTDPLYPRAAAMAEFTLDNMDSILEYERQFPSGTLHAGWRNWIYDSFSRSPILVQTIEQLSAEYRPGPLWPIYEEWKTAHRQRAKRMSGQPRRTK